jgi:hypothetical protein
LHFPYWLTVIIVSLALYGLWHFSRDLLSLACGRRPAGAAGASLLILVRDAEATIEYHLRRLLYDTALEASWGEIIIVDHGSGDLTPAILDRLAAASPLLRVIHLPPEARPVGEAMSFCRGDVVVILDTVTRLKNIDLSAAARRLAGR